MQQVQNVQQARGSQLEFALVTSREGFIYEGPGGEDGKNLTALADEIFSGWAVRIAGEDGGERQEEEPQCGGLPFAPSCRWVKILTHHGYSGWMDRDCLRLISVKELRKRQDKERFVRVGAPVADLHVRPKVQAGIQATLLRDSFAERLEETQDQSWTRVRTAAGTEGWLPSALLAVRMEDDAFLLSACGTADSPVKPKRIFYEAARRRIEEAGEEALRESVVQTALSFMGTQYRWGGKGSMGIDCSGLAFISWMEAGVLIYRDAVLMEDFPMVPIGRERLKKGDLIFFPGHVALYLGGGRYIHATGYAKTPYVTINSLVKGAADYREDLADQITGCATLCWS